MPASTRRVFREIRQSYTGEDDQAAKAGVGRKEIGLFRCSPHQRRFRALLALSLFNFNSAGRQHPMVSVYNANTFLAYTMTVSPRYDQLALIVPSATENAVGRLLGSPDYLQCGVPGLRLASIGRALGRSFGECFHLLHLPTGARAVVTASSNFTSKSVTGGEIAGGYPGLDTPLADVEQDALNRIPPMSAEIESILAALVSSLNVRDPNGSWATGMWWWDPFGRPKRAGLAPSYERYSQLWGSGRTWELRWNGFPYPEDLVACLTSPIIGLAGVSHTRVGDRWQLRSGSSALTLSYGGFCRVASERGNANSSGRSY